MIDNGVFIVTLTKNFGRGSNSADVSIDYGLIAMLFEKNSKCSANHFNRISATENDLSQHIFEAIRLFLRKLELGIHAL